MPDSNGVYFVPAFTGLGAPHWDMYARGTMVGLTRGVTSAHIARATLESIAFGVSDLITAMKADTGLALPELRVDGGASVSNVMMQFQSDLLGIAVNRPRNIETTALGAAFLAGLAIGFWHSKEDILSNWQNERVFFPQMSESRRESLISDWNRAVKRALRWAQSD